MSLVEPTHSVLIVDDDTAVGRVLAGLLAQLGMRTEYAESARDALVRLEARYFDVVVSDVRMPDVTGLELMRTIQQRWPGLPVVLLTAYGTIPLAVEAMRQGATDFLVKTCDRAELDFVIRKALATNRQCGRSAVTNHGTTFVGEAQPIRELRDLIRRAAASKATVLIRGESGTGKELVAHQIHEQSARKDEPFIKIHCAALPETLLESELFGYEKGAFTGAATRKPGRVELADGGTLFLDEIGDVVPAVQVKLLRLLQEREFERLGATKTQKVNVRIVAATHRHLEEMIERREFREDLFFRLNVIPLWLPALRERLDDLDFLIEHFCRVHGSASDRPGIHFEADAMAKLREQKWPGNVRQLENFIERVVVFADGVRVSLADVERELSRTGQPLHAPMTEGGESLPIDLQSRLRETERSAVLAALERSGNNRTLAARILGISRRTLYAKLEEHRLA